MLLAKRTGLSPRRAQELLARYAVKGGLKVKKTKGARILYVTGDATRHVLWDPQKDGTVILEEHDARCDC